MIVVQALTLAAVLALLALTIRRQSQAPRRSSAQRQPGRGVRLAVRVGGCVYCGRPAECSDHIRAVSRGGVNDEANLAGSCHLCNASKGDLLLIEWDAAKVLHAVAVEPKVYAELLREVADQGAERKERRLSRLIARANAAARARDDILATRRLVGLAEATATGILSISLENARKTRFRDPLFPESRGKRGEGPSAERLYDPRELRTWEQNRPRAAGPPERINGDDA